MSNQDTREHRDATRMATDLTFDLVLPDGLKSADRDEQITAWRSFRPAFALALSIRLGIGCDWRVLRVSLSNAYQHTFPRLHSFLQVALRDSVLAAHPVLHAEVLLFKADLSFGSGVHLDVGAADLRWRAITSRPATLDVVTLAEDLTGAYVEKLRDPAITLDSVWADKNHRRRISDRYYECLQNDPVSHERGAELAWKFLDKWVELLQCEREGYPLDIPLDVRIVARRCVAPLEESRAYEISVATAYESVLTLLPRRSLTTTTPTRLREASRSTVSRRTTTC